MIAESGSALTSVKIMPEMRSNQFMRPMRIVSGSGSRPGAGRPTVWAMLLIAGLAGAASASPDNPSWRTGTALERHWEAPVRMLRWGSNPLRDALASLSATQRVAVFLDRRVDPEQPIDFSSQDEPLAQLLARLAAELDLGTCRIGPVVYFGPPETAAVLPTVVQLRREERESFSPVIGRRLSRELPLEWPKLTAPRELIGRLAEEVGLGVRDLERIPHDLWPAVELPPLDFYQRMSLVLAGFGLTFQFEDDVRLRLVELPERAELQRDHPMPAHLAARIEARLRQAYPVAEVARQGGGLRVRAPWEVHQAIEGWLQGDIPRSPRGPVRPSEVRYTLEVQNQPVGATAHALAQRLELELRYPPELEAQLQQRVSFRVEEVTREQLLEALLEPANLTFQVFEQTLEILPAERD